MLGSKVFLFVFYSKNELSIIKEKVHIAWVKFLALY